MLCPIKTEKTEKHYYNVFSAMFRLLFFLSLYPGQYGIIFPNLSAKGVFIQCKQERDVIHKSRFQASANRKLSFASDKV